MTMKFENNYNKLSIINRHEGYVKVTKSLLEKYYPQPNKLYNIDKEEATWPEDAEDYLWWSSEADKWAENYAKSYKVRISPKDFLDLTTVEGADNLKDGDRLFGAELKSLDIDEFNKEKHQPMFLQVAFRNPNYPHRAEVVGHEGRHRMYALMKEGIKSVDIELRCEVYDTNYNKYKPFELDWIQLIGQFNDKVRVQVYNPIPMSWKKHKEMRPNLKDENLEERMDKIEDVFIFDNPYEFKEKLLSYKDKSIRCFIDETLGVYILADAYEHVHADMVEIASELYPDVDYDIHDNNQIALIYTPNNQYYFDLPDDVVSDNYFTGYHYQGFSIWAELKKQLEDFEIFKLLGKPTAILDYSEYFEDDELEEKIVPKGSKWQVQSEKGRNMGTYDTKAEAKKRLQQIHYFKNINEELYSNTPYMLRRDGALLECGEAHPYIKYYYEWDDEKNIEELLKHPESLEWYYNNTLNNEVKQLIDEFKETKDVNTFNELNDLLNNEFCRVRTSNMKYKYGGDNGEIYFRISSEGFNWFDLIWKVVLANKDYITNVTVLRDQQTFGKQFDYYQHNGKKLKHIPVEEFLTLSGNPIIENLNKSLLLEKTRSQLISKSKSGDDYAKTNQSKGRNRWERRKYSRISTTVADYNNIDMNAFWKGDILEFGIRVQGETDNYMVTVLFERIIERIRREIEHNKNKLEFKCILRALIQTFNSEDVYIHCTCPDFTYRFDYWSTKGNYNSGTPQFDPGKGIANPNDTKGAACKHVNLILANMNWMMKIASVINNYIWYCKDNMEINYARYIFPKLYGMDYDKAIQLTLFDTDDLETDEEIINLSNAIGRRRTQFKKAPEQSVNPRFERPKVERENPNQLKLNLEEPEEEEEVEAEESTEEESEV